MKDNRFQRVVKEGRIPIGHMIMEFGTRGIAKILEAAGATDCFETRVDGLDARAQHLAGKPDPAPFLEAAARLAVRPETAAIVEDALAGVEAGRRGGFGLVVGVDRNGQADALAQHGADIVVPDLAWLEIDADGRWRTRAPHDH
jgi:beta-phosphoglucomutase-like phosphatase (HAD superfamily)